MTAPTPHARFLSNSGGPHKKKAGRGTNKERKRKEKEKEKEKEKRREKERKKKKEKRRLEDRIKSVHRSLLEVLGPPRECKVSE